MPKWLLPRKSRFDQKEEEYGQDDRTKETNNDGLWNTPRKVEDALKGFSNCTRKDSNKIETGSKIKSMCQGDNLGVRFLEEKQTKM